MCPFFQMDDDFPEWIQAAERIQADKHEPSLITNLQEQQNLITNLQLQVGILTKELEKQDIWLMRAKRLIELYQYRVKDTYLNKRGDVLLKDM